MSYHIGQIRNSHITNFLTPVQNIVYCYGSDENGDHPPGIPTAGFGSARFYDFAICLGADISNPIEFTANQDYYLRFTIKRQLHHGAILPDSDDKSVFKINLRLIKERTSDGVYSYGQYQNLDTDLIFQPYLDKIDKPINEPYVGYETIFRPRDSGYKYLAFLLSRVQQDYYDKYSTNPDNFNPRSIYDGTAEGQYIFINENISGIEGLEDQERSTGDLCVINNILPTLGSGNDAKYYAMEKIGIQTKPGTLLCVNHEPIRVGRSGIYEVNNGVKVYFVGICGPDGDNKDNINEFVLDYAYNDNPTEDNDNNNDDNNDDNG